MYLGIYLKKNNKTNKQKKTKQTKTGKEKKEKKGRKKGMSRTRARHLRLVATFPNYYTTKADYVTLARSFLFNAFSTENPPANAIKVARYSFSGSIPPKFEHKLRRHKQSFGKIATPVVLDKDENLL